MLFALEIYANLEPQMKMDAQLKMTLDDGPFVASKLALEFYVGAGLSFYYWSLSACVGN